MKTVIFFLNNLFIPLTADAQKVLSISFVPAIDHESVVLDSTYGIGEITLSIHNLKYYISDLALYNHDTFITFIGKKNHLFDLGIPTSKTISQEFEQIGPFNQIRFMIGIDSLTHSAGVFEGDLDPMHGMYWTWQTGYIHFKLEGTSPACPTRQNKFQIHVGGYQYPYSTLREISIPINKSNKIDIELNLNPIISYLFEQKTYQLMRPGTAAVAFANQFSQLFQPVR